MLNSAVRDARSPSQGTHAQQVTIDTKKHVSAASRSGHVTDILEPEGCHEANSDSTAKSAADVSNGTNLPTAQHLLPQVETPGEGDSAVHFPLWITQTERVLVAPLLPRWTEQFISTCRGTIPQFLTHLSKPLRPLWISQSSLIWTNHVAPPQSLPFTPIYLVSASLPLLYHRRVTSVPRGMTRHDDPEDAEDVEPETVSYVYGTSPPRQCSRSPRAPHRATRHVAPIPSVRLLQSHTSLEAHVLEMRCAVPSLCPSHALTQASPLDKPRTSCAGR